MADSNPVERTPPGTPLPASSMPLHLSGFLHGDTIQVEGDTGDLEFSVQFSIHKRRVFSQNDFNFADANPLQGNDISCENASLSSYRTPDSIQEGNQQGHTDPRTAESDEIVGTGKSKTTILTRLKNGVITPVKYFSRISNVSSAKLGSEREVGLRKKCKGKKDLLEKMLKKRSLPVRPCSSYTLFVMATWGLVKSSSFGEVSKALGQMWCKLPLQEKKMFESMALKDSARYKKQCMLLRSKTMKRFKEVNRSQHKCVTTQ